VLRLESDAICFGGAEEGPQLRDLFAHGKQTLLPGADLLLELNAAPLDPIERRCREAETVVLTRAAIIRWRAAPLQNRQIC
jgi:hypothetical protein